MLLSSCAIVTSCHQRVQLRQDGAEEASKGQESKVYSVMVNKFIGSAVAEIITQKC